MTRAQESVVRLPIVRGPDAREEADLVVVEEPMEIQVDDRPLAVLMRTPGHDLDLAAGFLFTEGIIEDADDLDGLAHCADPNRSNSQNVVMARLAAGTRASPERFERARRAFFAGAGCGLCGKATIDHVFQRVAPLSGRIELGADDVSSMITALRRTQVVFEVTGGLHGAALFGSDGGLRIAREDVGRHNAVDKVIGSEMRADRWPLDGTVLAVSSRAGFEIVQKALVARIGAVVAVGAASSLAVELARDAGLTLITFARDGRYNRHVG